jgi:carnitine-CoA ligase
MTASLRDLSPTLRTVPALLERQTARHGDRTLLRAPGGAERSYAGLRDAAARWAGMLHEAGVRTGDRVAAICGNRVELVELVLGCGWLGAAAVPLNTAIRGAQLSHALTNSGARFLMLEPDCAAALELVPPPPELEQVWVLGEGRINLPPGYPQAPLPERREAIEPQPISPRDTFTILYTSGTTGLSKGVCCPHAQFWWWGVINGEWLAIKEDDVLFTTLPLFHTNALNSLFQALATGATHVLGRRFSASRHWAQAADCGATITYLLGAMVGMLQAQPPAAGDREHRVERSLAPATPPNLFEPFRQRFGVQLINGYGSTEAGHVMGVPGDQCRPAYLGRAIPELEAQVVDEDDAAVPDGTAGELVVRSREPYFMFTGYFGMPGTTVESWRNLWFHTGDRVIREPDGWYRFVDRAKDAIRRRGENISSVEVEQVLLEHPSVKAAAVFPVPSELAEDEVMAAIVPEEGARLDPLDLMRHCEARLAYFAIPRFVDFVDELPLTENGKVRKPVLRERGVGPATWDRERAGYELAR